MANKEFFTLEQEINDNDLQFLSTACRANGVTYVVVKYDYPRCGISLIRFSARAESNLKSAISDFQQIKDIEMNIPF